MVDQTPPQHIPTLINGARCDGTQKPSFGLHLVYIPLYPRYIPDVHNIYPCLYPNWHLKVVPSPCISMGFGHCWCVPSWKCGGLWSSHHHWWDENPLKKRKHHKLLTMANIIIYIYTYIYKHIILHLEYLIICYLKGLAPTAHRRSPNMIRTSPSIGEEARQPFLSCAELSAQRLALALAVAVEPRRHILFREGAWGLVSGWTWVNMGKYMGNYG